jgi:hypothetical protein
MGRLRDRSLRNQQDTESGNARTSHHSSAFAISLQGAKCSHNEMFRRQAAP